MWGTSGAERPGNSLQRAPGALRRALHRVLEHRLLPVLIGIAIPLVLAVAVLSAFGIRLFVVGSPSMGAAAPVGTLVVDAPVRLGDVRVGDVVTYRPPPGGRPITHRVVSIRAAGLTTRGDVNGAADPWRLTQPELIGRAVLIIPGAGWPIRALPILLIGSAVVWGGTALIPTSVLRGGLRVTGAAALASLTLTPLHPLANVEVLATQPTARGVSVAVVSTGLLPVQVGPAGAQAVLSTGEVAHLVLNASSTGMLHLPSQLHLPPLGWVALLLICLLPMLWVLVVGLPVDETEEAA